MSLELKLEIIKTDINILKTHEEGVQIIDLIKEYGRSSSKICPVLKNKELIKGIASAKSLTIISERRKTRRNFC